jgi:hypothetical protein
MALLGDGYKIIADKFQEEANLVELIGVEFPAEGDDVFRGVFDTEADLNDAYPPNDETDGSFAFVKTSDEGDASYFQVGPIGPVNNAWLKTNSLHRTTLSGTGTEIAWDANIEVTPTYIATTITSAAPGGLPLQLASPLVFEISAADIGSSLGIMVQGIKFQKYDDSLNVYDYYIWGFGTDDWASFTEPGEFIVTSWNFRLGGFGG